jgi:hypothetical protein
MLDGVNPWMHWFSDYTISRMAATKYDGWMMDNGDSYAEDAYGPDGSWYGYMDWPANYHTAMQQSYSWHNTYVDATTGANKLMGRNAGYFTSPISLTSDWTLLESYSSAKGEAGYGNPRSTKGFPADYSPSFLYVLNVLGIDGLLPASNPNGTKAVFHYIDNSVGYYNAAADASGAAAMDGRAVDGGYFVWDKRNRRPMALLAYYYIGANENSIFAYNAFGAGSYAADDIVRYHTGATTTLAE